MADIKRPNYFNTQFLKEDDFNDEQSYHRDQLKRHNLNLHSPGIVSGLDVIAQTGGVRVQIGMAVDSTGQEIVLTDPQDISLSSSAAGSIPINIWYSEVADADPNHQSGGKATRMVVRPRISPRDGSGPNTAAGEGPAIPLALVPWDGATVDPAKIDRRVRQLATVPANSIGISQLKLQLVAQGAGVNVQSGPGTPVQPVQTNVQGAISAIYWPTITIRSTTAAQSKIQAFIVYMQAPGGNTVDIGIGFNNQGGPAVVDWRVYTIGA